MYHLTLFIVLFIASIGGGGVQNDGYQRLARFEELEKRQQLDYAKNNLKEYDSMLQIDLQEFSNANEFKAYLKNHDISVDRAEAMFIGWLLAFCVELGMFVVFLCHSIRGILSRR